jgi:hypothetical protein
MAVNKVSFSSAPTPFSSFVTAFLLVEEGRGTSFDIVKEPTSSAVAPWEWRSRRDRFRHLSTKREMEMKGGKQKGVGMYPWIFWISLFGGEAPNHEMKIITRNEKAAPYRVCDEAVRYALLQKGPSDVLLHLGQLLGHVLIYSAIPPCQRFVCEQIVSKSRQTQNGGCFGW